MNYTKIEEVLKKTKKCETYEELIEKSDAVYIRSNPLFHYEQVKYALKQGKHVLCESPIALQEKQCKELFDIARNNNCILTEGIKTAFSTAYYRLILLAKTRKIGDIISVDATCTSLKKRIDDVDITWNSMYEWGPTALLPVFQILGRKYNRMEFATKFLDKQNKFDIFTQYPLPEDACINSPFPIYIPQCPMPSIVS